jgi:hypothetical protein
MPLRALILHNFWLKFFSVALAAVIWLAIHYSIDHDLVLRESDIRHMVTQRFIRIPVLIVSAPGDNRAFNVNPKQVEVVALGEDSVLRDLTQADIKAHIDLSEFRAQSSGEVEVHADVPRDVTITGINPPVVSVQVSKPK